MRVTCSANNSYKALELDHDIRRINYHICRLFTLKFIKNVAVINYLNCIFHELCVNCM